MNLAAFGEPMGQSWDQFADLGIAFVLSVLIGLERELKQKSAGVRTYTVVGFASALWMLVSKYGFTDVLRDGTIMVDPSRVAAQIVAGVGFIGGGIIFVRRDSVVHGLTTAAGIFLTASIGAAAGGGLSELAIAGTVGYFVAVWFLPPLARWSRRFVKAEAPSLRVRFYEGQGLVQKIVATAKEAGFHVTDIATTRHEEGAEPGHHSIELRVFLDGKGDVQSVVDDVSDIPGILAVSTFRNDSE
ncbi:MAG: MgtC/SapB family protein [Nocardiaceae bacterium]|nr:MgtC/SapB family protein [Nocardiaceae bacterium]